MDFGSDNASVDDSGTVEVSFKTPRRAGKHQEICIY